MLQMNGIKKGLVLCLSGFLILITSFVGNVKVEAASFTENLLYGAAAFAYINGQLNNLNDNHQKDLLAQTQKQTGVYENEEKDAYLANVAQRLMTNGIIKGHYAVYLTPDKSINAFCTLGRVIAVNKGTIEMLDEDEFASILGHEMGHGEHKDPVEGTKKSIGLGVLVDLYLQDNPGITSQVLGVASANYINNEVITMQEEWAADNAGFDNAVAAGYNPGGGAAAMAFMRSKLGELWHDGLSKIVSPNNHPKTSDRVNNFSKRMTDYSHGHVTVKGDKTVCLDGVEIITPAKTERYLAAERTYLIAGKLAREYHNNTLETVSVGQNGTVYMGDRALFTPVDGDSDTAQEVADKINVLIKK
ncbi:hypothetical protein Ga0466249_001462 [Sporomusaceae bacterium BoRhaA]|uniref:M48 family metalloprotease n=1 Tax=Pelorhabdus rhamnosifermentans TaxID=2772457 RepID=UPI001C063A18|nr:M48 family metalloprotease [Pelorhabdus rhamnosifermentans]MBU2700370.1 hypothetical protein [Pelorhabdus rhamnosifermentans]